MLRESIRNISEQLNNNEPFAICMGNFLDEFYRQTQDIRQQMINDEPEKYENIPNYDYAYLAATAHKLANDYKLERPDWVYKNEYFLPGDQPYFGGNVVGNLRLIFMYESPIEFKMRNIFTSHNCLTRV